MSVTLAATLSEKLRVDSGPGSARKPRRVAVSASIACSSRKLDESSSNNLLSSDSYLTASLQLDGVGKRRCLSTLSRLRRFLSRKPARAETRSHSGCGILGQWRTCRY